MRSTIIIAATLIAGVGHDNPLDAQQVFMHGYATQGYGQTTEYAQAGLGINGTSDLRSAAAQLRVAFFSTGTQFVFQGAHRRVGGSPISTLIDDVELDWAFAEQRLGDLAVRVGRVPIPKGLVNERRDVGTLLPFYQASKAFYTDGIETVDGITARFSRMVGDFDVEVQGFTGTVPIVISLATQDGPQAIDESGEGTYGGQFSIGLPMVGFRVLGGMLDTDIPIMTQVGPVELDWEYQWLGVEYQDDGYYARAEHSWSMVPTFQRSRSYYVQAGARVHGEFWLNGQREHSFARILGEPAVGFEYDPVSDWAIGVTYKFSSTLVIKGEQHFSDGYNFDQLVNIAGPALKNRYFLLSVSAAF